MELFDKLYSDLRLEILKYLPHDKADQNITADIAAQDTTNLLTYFLNWVARNIHQHPREALLSNELQQNPLFAQHAPDIMTIIKKIEDGEDMSPHLTARTSFGYEVRHKNNKKNLNARKDLDLLLCDWGIHHLHLSNSLNNGRVTRTGLLLFGIFMPQRAYLLDLLPHGSWGNQKLVQMAVHNWPEAELFLDLKGILPSQTSWTDEELQKIRGAGVGASVNVDGTVYFSRTLGISSAGTSTRSSIEAMRFMRCLKETCTQIEREPEYLKPYVEKAGGIWPLVPQYSLIFSSGPERYTFAIYLENANTAIGIWPLYA